jgi:hypothetical protein
MTDPRIKPLEPTRWVDPMADLASDIRELEAWFGPGVVRQREMTAAGIREEFGVSVAMERKAPLERAKNARMRGALDALRPTDTVHGEGG